MDRHLEIALVSSALAIVWGYGFRLRLQEGYALFIWKPVNRNDNPAVFWTIMLLLGMGEALFIVLALMNFAAWLDSVP
jgi:hypothetical protein